MRERERERERERGRGIKVKSESVKEREQVGEVMEMSKRFFPAEPFFPTLCEPRYF